MFSTVLLNFRVKNNLSQTKAAEILGTSQRMISLYEKGKTEPTARNRIILMKKMASYERED